LLMLNSLCIDKPKVGISLHQRDYTSFPESRD
jgi:hypothetical protein